MNTSCHQPTARKLTRRATTLIEVIGASVVVAGTLALVTPMFAAISGNSKQAQCIANLKSLAQASAAYSAADRHETSIPVHPLIVFGGARSDGAHEWGGKSGDIGWGTRWGYGPPKRPLNRTLYDSSFPDYMYDPGPEYENWMSDTKLELNEYRCPSDTGYTGHHFRAWKESGKSSYDHFGNSYAANVLWIGSKYSWGQKCGCTNAPNGCKLASNSPFLRTLSRVPSPADTLLFWENCGRFAWRVNYGVDACETIWGTGLGDKVDVPVLGWHGAPWEFEAAFIDGHVGTISMQGHHVPQPRLETYPLCRASPGIYESWHCGIIRGSGWRIDTLPDVPIQTGMWCGDRTADNSFPVHHVSGKPPDRRERDNKR